MCSADLEYHVVLSELTQDENIDLQLPQLHQVLQGCKPFANLETKIWTKILSPCALVRMKGNMSQIYPIPILSLSKKNYIGENLFANFFSSFN